MCVGVWVRRQNTARMRVDLSWRTKSRAVTDNDTLNMIAAVLGLPGPAQSAANLTDTLHAGASSETNLESENLPIWGVF